MKTASVFYGRIIWKERERDFRNMLADLAAHYAEQRPAAMRVEEGRLYAVQEEAEFHRWEPESCCRQRTLTSSA